MELGATQRFCEIMFGVSDDQPGGVPFTRRITVYLKRITLIFILVFIRSFDLHYHKHSDVM